MTTTAEKMKAYEEALQKVVDDSAVGCVPASHISRIKRLLGGQPTILYVVEYQNGVDPLAYYKEADAFKAEKQSSHSLGDIKAFIELTPELEKLAKERGLL